MAGRIDMIGEKVSIGGGNSEKQDGFGGGTMQYTGERVTLSRASRPVGQFTDQPMGSIQEIGDKMPLSRKPNRGYESGTPLNSETHLPDTSENF